MGLVVEIRNLVYQYSPHLPNALGGISFNVLPNTCCAILGPTGAGKSTILQAISGILRSHHRQGKAEGVIRIGDVIHQPIPDKSQFPNVGYVLQEPEVHISGLFETVAEEITFTLRTLDVPPTLHADRVRRITDALGLGHLLHRNPTHLSGGETQRVALATILVAEPPILLLDEPTTSLDIHGQMRLYEYLRKIKQTTTLLIAETNIDLALFVADYLVVLEGGQIVFNGTKAEFIQRIADFSSILAATEWHDILKSIANPRTRAEKRLASVLAK
ncbi:MAG TPA: ABC transporter ATP-binding protein [Bacteroidota bacterium]|nr:ABC transporter ATP-binding protein [Bacteroidota bacterium]